MTESCSGLWFCVYDWSSFLMVTLIGPLFGTIRLVINHSWLREAKAIFVFVDIIERSINGSTIYKRKSVVREKVTLRKSVPFANSFEQSPSTQASNT